MANGILEATKLNSKFSVAQLRRIDESRLIKLKQNSGWNTTNGSKRGRLDIIAEILTVCDQRKSKTSIMYKAKLNYAQLKSHLEFLTRQGLLTNNMNKYATTEKGYRFLELFVQLSDILNQNGT
jgi:predicted transcriptional regulator